MREDGKEKTKCKRILMGAYGQKDYLKDKYLFAARQVFRTRVGLLPLAGNYKKSNKFLQTNWLCPCLKESESESHIKDGGCTSYMDIREKYGSLEDDEELVKFFGEVISRRDALDEDRGGAAYSATDALLAGDSSASQSGGLFSAD